MRLRINSLDFINPRVPASTTGLKLRGVSYLGSKFDVVVTADRSKTACFRGWATNGVQLKIGPLGSGTFTLLPVTTDVCFKYGVSVRIVGARSASAML
eukprot:SAG31_NODE_4693_length_3029_cov_1.192833_2_plen_98_part_00